MSANVDYTAAIPHPGEVDDHPRHNGNAGRLLPHNLEVEEALVGALLLSSEAVASARERCSPEDLYRPGHKHVVAAVYDLHAAGLPHDPVTVADELARRGLLEQVGGSGQLLALQAGCPSTSSAGHYANVVAELARFRRLISELSTATEQAYKADPATAGTVARLAAMPAGASTLDERPTWAPVDLAARAAEPITPPVPGVLHRSDGPGLIYPGKIHLLLSPPEGGKSILAATAAGSTLRTGGRVLWVDFESTAEELILRLRALGIPDAWLGRVDYRRPDEPFTAAIVDALARTAPDLLVVDSLGELAAVLGIDDISGKSAHEIRSVIYSGFLRKFLAVGTAVVVIDHVTKDTENRGNYAIGNQAKTSGADVVIGLEPVEPVAPGRVGRVKVMIRKDRPGALNAATTITRRAGKIVRHWADLVADATGATLALTLYPPPPAAEAAEAVDSTDALSRLEADVLAFLESEQATEPERAISQRVIRMGVKGRDDDIRAAVERLVVRGVLKQEKGPNRSLRQWFPVVPSGSGNH